MSGFAHRMALPTDLTRHTMAPEIHAPHPQQPVCALSRVSLKGLAPLKLQGPIWPLALGGSSLLCLSWRAVSSLNPAVGHPASTAIPGPSHRQQSPAPPAPGVREPLALAMGAQVVHGEPEQGPVEDPLGATIWVSRTSPLGAGPTQIPKSTHLPDPVPSPQQGAQGSWGSQWVYEGFRP